MIRRRQVLTAMAAAAMASAWGAGVLRLIVAYPPGGISDQVARLLADRLGPELGTTVIVENRPGAGGGVALAQLAFAPADGRTLAFSAISPLALSPHLGAPTPQVAPVAGVMHTPLLLVGTPALAARRFEDMVERARTEPLRWATSGIGTIGHLALEQVRSRWHLSLVHIPYNGGAPQLQDALAGRFELLSTNLAPLQIEYVRGGRLMALALGAPRRSQLLPDVPTFAEAGCPQANLTSLFGVFAPQRTPARTIAMLNSACARVLARADFQRELARAGNLPAPGSAEAFAREIEQQSAAHARLVNSQGFERPAGRASAAGTGR